jgi:hypothetical protein
MADWGDAEDGRFELHWETHTEESVGMAATLFNRQQPARIDS